MTILAKIGSHTFKGWSSARHVAAVAWSVLSLSTRRRNWPRTVRNLLARQVLFTGIEAMGLTSLIAILAGVSVVTQTQVLLSKLGQSAMLGSVLVAVIIREIGPLLVNFIVIGRSGTAITTELANMRVRHEIKILDAQGVDPTVYLVIPRVLGVVISVFCLTIMFVAVSFGSGYLFGLLLGITAGDPVLFARSVMDAITPRDILNLLAKTIAPGLATGTICCVQGMGIRESVTEVPRAATHGVVRSIAALLVISAIVSVLTYV